MKNFGLVLSMFGNVPAALQSGGARPQALPMATPLQMINCLGGT